MNFSGPDGPTDKSDSTTQQVAKLLQRQNSQHFKRAASAFYQAGAGMIPNAVSDHLPIQLQIATAAPASPLSLVSWNLLSDQHLENNFRNLPGLQVILQGLQERYSANLANGAGQLHVFFNELVKFLSKKINPSDPKLDISAHMLDEFIASAPNKFPQARAQIVEFMMEEMGLRISDDAAHTGKKQYGVEFQNAIYASLNLHHHIVSDTGAYKWENRFKRLVTDPYHKELLATLQNSDLLCLQECTKPADLQNLFPQKKMLEHKVFADSKDHCVILYDPKKMECIEPVIRGALAGGKPFILAKFKNLQTGEELIVGSIHHPGGAHASCLPDLLKQVEKLGGGPGHLPFYLVGDFNNPQDSPIFTTATPLPFRPYFPESTMGGSDYGNRNEGIDGAVVGEVSSDRRTVKSIMSLKPELGAAPAENLQVKITYVADEKTKERRVGLDPARAAGGDTILGDRTRSLPLSTPAAAVASSTPPAAEPIPVPRIVSKPR